MAEAIFRHKVELAGLADEFKIESAGTGDWHVGDNPDPRTIKVLADNGISKYNRARRVKASDFEHFDHIVAMDVMNVADLEAWEGAQPEKVSLMARWNLDSTTINVPDPYYGGKRDFEDVFKMLDGATQAMLTKLKN